MNGGEVTEADVACQVATAFGRAPREIEAVESSGMSYADAVEVQLAASWGQASVGGRKLTREAVAESGRVLAEHASESRASSETGQGAAQVRESRVPETLQERVEYLHKGLVVLSKNRLGLTEAQAKENAQRTLTEVRSVSAAAGESEEQFHERLRQRVDALVRLPCPISEGGRR